MAVPAEAEACLTEWLGPGWSVTPLFGDASVRAYYRVSGADGTSYILSWYPDEVRGQLERVTRAYAALSPNAPLPRILHVAEAAMLQEDVGDRTLRSVLEVDAEAGRRLFATAVDLLIAFQRSEDPGLNRPFTAEFFHSELEMARRYYVELLMEAAGEPVVPFLKTISENISRHPYRLCHRDFHSQNIHVLNDSIYLIDYQDLHMGPDTYDLASLLRDRGVASILGEDFELELLERYRTGGGLSGDVRRRYFETLLQRSIKILGTFARQAITRGRLHYLEFIPGALVSIERCLEELPDLAALRDIFPLRFSPERAAARARELNTA